MGHVVSDEASCCTTKKEGACSRADCAEAEYTEIQEDNDDEVEGLQRYVQMLNNRENFLLHLDFDKKQAELKENPRPGAILISCGHSEKASGQQQVHMSETLTPDSGFVLG
eukprot:CAMPEP_0169298770 /NCGR_PEP_ID=MMETSP1016-20121227/66694_1 /TAXON_ID=342587 /ORGANISM="Karlodinium micrum, Strain CCMP2283" /LENGTH=110 /DNA_ID=CAMNT_0009390937 /DNA_START=43 /DNA_END=372 /DNA_ORIENTATION=-